MGREGMKRPPARWPKIRSSKNRSKMGRTCRLAETQNHYREQKKHLMYLHQHVQPGIVENNLVEPQNENTT